MKNGFYRLSPVPQVIALIMVALQGFPALTCHAGQEVPVVVLFGDSTTAPRPGAVDKVYGDRVGEAFEAAGDRIRIINRGVGSDTTARARKRFVTDVLAECPALVVVQFGINDAAVDVWKDPPARRPRVSQKDYVGNLRWMAEQARKAGIDLIFMTPNPLRWTEKMRQLYGRPPYDSRDPLGLETPFFLSHLAALRALARELDVTIIDIHAAYAERERQSGEPADAFLLDGIHPNDAGHALVAEKLVPAIRERLRPRRAED